MLCLYPYVSADKTPFPCGQCLHCRVNQRRVWTARLCLEDQVNGPGLFHTLTYDEDNCPPLLVKADLQKYFKRLRKAGHAFRYFGVGEYGAKTRRPHYHVLFYRSPDAKYHEWSPEFHLDLDRKWPSGHTFTGNASRFSAAYCAGYVTKKASAEGQDAAYSEWILTSRNPALGIPACSHIADSLVNYGFFKEGVSDVPTSMKFGDMLLPLGRAIRTEIREIVTRS